MRKLLLVVLYGIGAVLFVRFFSAPLYHILLVLFFGGLAVLIFSGRWLGAKTLLSLSEIQKKNKTGGFKINGAVSNSVLAPDWSESESALKDMFWLISLFLWLANIFGFLANGLNFTAGIFLAFAVAFLIFWGSLPRVGRPGAKTLLFSPEIQQQNKGGDTETNGRVFNSVLAPGPARTFVYSFSGALITAEFFWAAAFLPFGYLTLAGLLFIVFYLIWTIFCHYLRGKLNREVIFKNLAFSAALFTILLLSARWQP